MAKELPIGGRFMILYHFLLPNPLFLVATLPLNLTVSPSTLNTVLFYSQIHC